MTALVAGSFCSIGVALLYFIVLLYAPSTATATSIIPIIMAVWISFLVVLLRAIGTTLRV